ncbi:hypothetical protein IFM89_029617 [Coptis chinensis]|uniref:Uncharacterized protein n=1 Tax=Coptis chinensis TaxID=261450 RepID=A0A835IIK9_9MAGN|nr:hypothetical protein IFM89_029617 [Coptis chinensis]
MGGGVGHVMKRIPRIKFPQRHPPNKPKPSTGSTSNFFTKSEVPAQPASTSLGGKASLQPNRTPVSEKEIEAVLLGGCF